jgi:DNA-binding transcriptional LysR family regulator
MQIESLRVFCDVARYRSFSKAADANHVTQSAASQIVQLLEERLGVTLVDRSTRPLQLTVIGQTYYVGCKQLVDQYLELEASIRQAQAQMEATLEVAAIYSVVGDLERAIERFRQQHPDVKIHPHYHHPDQVYREVREGTADLGLVSFPRRTREFEALHWRDERMVLACKPEHPLARQTTIAPADLHGQKYVAFHQELTIRKQVDRFLRDLGVTVEIDKELDNIDSIKQAIVAAGGVALLPEPTLQREVQAGILVAVPLAGSQLYRPLGFIYRRRHPLTSAAQCFMELVCATPERMDARDTDRDDGKEARASFTLPRGPMRNGTAKRSRRTD